MFPQRVHTNIVVIAVLLASTALGVTPSVHRQSSAFDARIETALSGLKRTYPGVQYSGGTGRVTSLYGSAFGSGGSPEETAEQFVQEYSQLFGANPDELVAGSLLPDHVHTQPMMYNRETDSYKFTLVYYRQFAGDLPVFRSELRLLVRNESGYPLVLAKSSLHNLAGFVSRGTARAALQNVSSYVQADNPGLDEFHMVEPVIWAGTNGSRETPRDAIQVVGTNDIPEAWLYVLDAETGEVLFKEDRIIFETVSGNVSGQASEGGAADHCENEVLTPLPYVHVGVGEDSCFADSAGNYSLDGSFGGPVDVVSSLRGEHFFVIDSSGPEAMLSKSVTGGGVADFVHNEANTDEGYRAQVNAYVAANQVRDFVLSIHPDYPSVLENRCPEINVNLPNSQFGCPGNAWYRWVFPQSINFCASGYSPDYQEDFSNTAFSSVVYHEYGHHLVEATCSGQDQYGEGMADCISMLMLDDPVEGLGYFLGDCERYVRNPVESNVQFPCQTQVDGTPHYCGMVLSGCVWALREEFYLLYPTSYMDTLANLTINSILLHLGGTITPDIAVDFLVLDDDDYDITNGTPHQVEICSAFLQHNIRCPRFEVLDFSYSEVIPEYILPDDSYSVQLGVVSGGAAEPIAGTGIFHYAINGFDYQQGTMVEISANNYEITFPQVPAGGVINWYVTVESDLFGTCYNPLYYDLKPYELIVATDKVLLFEDDFNEERGWTHEHSAQFLGDPWVRDIPSQDSPYSDRFYEDYDGSGYCYLTGNGWEWPGVGVGWSSLMSPEWSFADGVVRVDYARWWDNLVNSAGYGLSDDSFFVYVSGDSGQSWQLAEFLDPWYSEHRGGWFTDYLTVNSHMLSPTSVMVKFKVHDNEWYYFNGNDAAIDAVQVHLFPVITDLTIYTSYVPPATVYQPYSLQLEALGGTGELAWSDKYGNLSPSGLSLSPSGLVAGTPLVSGKFSFTALAVDGAGLSAERLYSIVISSAFEIVDNFPTRYTWSGLMGLFFEVDGGSPPYTWSNPSQTLHTQTYEGLVLEEFSLGSVVDEWGLHGTFIYDDSIWFNIAAKDAAGACDTIEVTIYTVPYVEVVTTQLDTAYVGHPYEFQIEITGGIAPYTYRDYYYYDYWGRPGEEVDRDAMGIKIEYENLHVGLITGVPKIAGDFHMGAWVIDSAKASWHSDEYHRDVYHFPTLTVAYKALCGDIQIDGVIDIGDLTHLISYLFIDGPAPEPIEMADFDESGEVDIGDLTRMIDFLFISGDPLQCPPIGG